MEVVAIAKVDLSGGMNLEEIAPAAGAAAGKNSAGLPSGAREGDELVRGGVREENDDDGKGDDTDNSNDNNESNGNRPHRVDRLA
jgi:hypothetical protein